jgi:threonine/homoserine/homoserine lactone efflux protein
MNESLLVAYLLTIAVVILIPGPDMLFCLASGLKGGPRSGYLAALGAATGEVAHIAASAVGLAALFRAAPPLFHLVRLLGAVYLIVLGARALSQRPRVVAKPGEGVALAGNRAYWQGLTTNLLNPKMALFSISFLPQFIDPSAGNVAVQFLVLGACFIVLDFIVDCSVGVLSGRLRRLLDSRRARRRLNAVAGSVYVGLGLRIALER